ncbi:AAA family ATPase [Melissococcus plutonius]|uniref:AAA family ATPase n=1 Tax=Melissococcus plutonius TaxID=33970 RepID=UPI0021E5C474|nr:AAA family ATPase [Melissococcus plutonius]MCV2499613.1 AAA family ATPase [Melissococcus plutonius]MCV2501533.1 AAA family ATPase [Melissococcus plutonius]MCV2508207.1 AAA family ATPase [Melissococcus plutonius]MCV2520005.1 AAA family ATPase [Melissococcus plutonius]MCV2528015.1 AAA family ATPase [Melissococcus plutonius]
MKYSYSRVSLFDQCPYHFKLRYLDKYQEVPDYSANSPLILGQALHKGIETNYETMLEDYYKSFPVITDAQINEAIKLEKMLPKVIDFIDNNFKQCELIHEYKIDKPEYIGYVDLIVKDAEGQCLVIDFKYSNNIKNYLDSEQLHIYKYYLEQDGFKIKQLGFLFIEKVNIKQGKSNLYQFRKRLTGKLKSAKVTFIPIEFNKSKVTKFLNSIKQIESTTEYPSNPSGQCFSCAAINNKKASKYTTLTPPDYLNILQNTNGEIEMVLPSVERRDIEKVTKRVMWWYGAPFTGKTTLANEFPNPLMLNTDGNIRFVDAPFVSIADKVEVKGRITETIKAWEILDETILDLEKGDNEFKTIVIDLLEDIYQACRFYEYDKLGIEHESDNSFKAWDIVRNTFLQMMKRIVHLPYENIIFISHEDISKDVTKKTGDKITSITPNLQDKAALKVAGMVDIVGRIVADDDIRKMEFKSKDYVFGGGRLPNLPVTEIDLDVKQIMDVYDQANKGLHKKINASVSNVDEAIKSTLDNQEVIAESEDDTVPPGETIGTVAVEKTEELPKRKRRKRKIEESTDDVIEGTSTRRRRRRGV